jgi:hypothetical protein
VIKNCQDLDLVSLELILILKLFAELQIIVLAKGFTLQNLELGVKCKI